jgi:deazaflavin-dependent oxidoreductase (nitroreductase family)
MPAARAPSIVPLMNSIFRRVVGAGLPSGPNVVMTVVGRATGIPRTFPVALMEVDDHRYVQSTFGDVNWVRNLRAAGEATITKGRRRDEYTAVELAPDDAGRVVHAAVTPYLRSFVGRRLVKYLFHLGPEATVDDFVAAGADHPTFELRPKNPR